MVSEDIGDHYMECLFKVDTSPGWQISVTQVLINFEDISFEIDSPSGLVYVKGKTIPQKILLKLIKAGKHATIIWITYGMQKDNQQQAQYPQNAINQGKGHDPYYQQQFLLPYNQSWNNNTNNCLPQSGVNNHVQHGLGYEPSGHGGEMGGSSRPDQHYCPVHSRRRHSPVSSSSGFAHAHNSSPSAMQSGANGQARNKPSSRKRNFIKKFVQKIILPCF
ncbi:unnamed protein product [Lupinus luteus]|uniref:Uncharacterized protein n=1 Tax=Lupinus luteus TaxID=3873 RepID=A0AAV1W5V2_LUPLU